MDYLPLRFKNKLIEKEFLQKTSFIIRRFYTITIVILFLMSFYSTLYIYLSNKPSNNLTRIYNVSCLSITFTALVVQLKFNLRIIAPLIAFGLGIGIITINFVAAKNAFDTLPATLYKPFVEVYYAGFLVGMFYIFLEHLFIRLHVKLGYVIVAVILRWTLVPTDQFINILNATFIDVANLVIMYLYERNNRSLFKSFYDKRDENEKFRTLLTEHFPQNIVILDKNLEKMLFANKSFIEHFEAETIIEVKRLFSHLRVNTNTLNTSLSTDGRSFSTQSLPTLAEYIETCKKDPKQEGKILSFNSELGEAEDHKVTYECKICPLDWDGTSAFTIMFNDMTQQETILALKIADENKDRLLATVSHELRTPINGMIGVTNIIEQEYQDPKLLSYVQSAKVCAKMLLNLVNSILDMAQVRHNCIRLNPLNFKIEDMTKEVESIFRPQCTGKNIEFATVIEEHVKKNMVSDQGRLIQIIVNLLSNALKFTTQGKILLRVSAGVDDKEIRFSVEDTGAGIKDEDKPKLFKAFGKLEQTNPRVNSQGVGLGLTISNTLVGLLHPKRAGNKIEFESVYGKGTTFFFTVSAHLKRRLPIKKEEQKDSRESEEKSSHGYTELMAECKPEEKKKSWNRLATPYEPSKFIKERKPVERELHIRELGNILSTLGEEKELLQDKDERIEIMLKSPSDQGTVLPVLVVDDNPLNLMIASKLLEKLDLGLTVATAFNGQEAINKVRQQDRTNFFKVILMDCEMPIMNGLEATQALRVMIEKGEIPDVPIYALTANESENDKEKCIQAGMSGCLTKPLRPEEMRNLIQMISK